MKNNTLDRLQNNHFTKKIMAILFFGAMAFTHPLLAQTTWTGTTSDDWNTPTNWDTGNVPSCMDNVIIPDISPYPIIKNGTNAEVKRVDIQTDGQLDVEDGATLTIILADFSGLINRGTVNNEGKISTINTGTVGINNEGVFNNAVNGKIQVDKTGNDGIRNNTSSASFSNYGKISIGKNGTIGRHGIRNQSSSNFTNEACANLEIYNNLSNVATFTNNGSILFETTEAHTVGNFTNNGLVNATGSPFNSTTNDEIIINKTTNTSSCQNGISPAFNLGTIVDFSIDGIFTDAEANTTAGTYDQPSNTFTPIAPFEPGTDTTFFVKITDTGNGCISMVATWNLTGDFTTWTGVVDSDWDNTDNWTGCVPNHQINAIIPLTAISPIIKNGTDAKANRVDIQATAQLDIEEGATLSISNSGFSGLVNRGTVNNDGDISITNTGTVGLYNEGVFNNTVNGKIQVDTTGNDGIRNTLSSASFSNSGSIIIGKNGAIGRHGIRNQSASNFTNEACATLEVYHNLSNVATFANNGFIFFETTKAHAVGNFTNNGVTNAVGSLFNSPTNNEVTVNRTFVDTCMTDLSTAFDLGASVTFSIDGIFSDEAMTISAGTYDQVANTFTPNDDFEGGMDTIFYVKITDNGNGCASFSAQWKLVEDDIATWAGVVDNDWDNPGNWIGCVPDTGTLVTIPNTATYPVIKNGTDAKAKKVTIQATAELNIEDGATLAIANSDLSGLVNNGELNNEGEISINNAGSIGLYNVGVFNNNSNGEISIDRLGSDGVRHLGGTFNNEGNISIKHSNSIGISIVNNAPFENNGVISIDSSGSHAIQTNGVFNNSGGSINILKSGNWGIRTSAPFYNINGGEIHIDYVGLDGIQVRTDVFINTSVIKIGQNGGPLSIFHSGIRVDETFINCQGGEITIDNVRLQGIWTNLARSGIFSNKANIYIGQQGPNSVGRNSIICLGGYFNNDRDALLSVHHPIELRANSVMTNDGKIHSTFCGYNPNAGTLINNNLIESPAGIIQWPNILNNGTVVTLFEENMCCPTTHVLFVDGSIPYNSLNNGEDWNTAMTTLGKALELATICGNVTEIWVADGTYYPTTGTDRTAAFAMMNDIAIYGGFNGTETELSQRDPALYPTILSGDIGTQGDASDNSYHVFFHDDNGLDATAILDGFVIKNGNADYIGNDEKGGGMFNKNASPTVRNCVFENNSAIRGGAMFNDVSSAVIEDCNFNDNDAEIGGAVVNSTNSTTTFTRCVFENNSAVDNGGAVFNIITSVPTFMNCTFDANSTDGIGGGIQNISSSPNLYNCLFTNNTADEGAAIANMADACSPNIVNCTFSANDAGTTGGIVRNLSNSTPVYTNCIFWGNASNTSGTVIADSPPGATVTYSIVEGGYPGTGNMDVDPMFVSATDLHLEPCSPAIGRGNNSANSTMEEMDGHARIVGNIDLGVYERATGTGTPIVWTGNGDGENWSDAANWDTGAVPQKCNDVLITAPHVVKVQASMEGLGRTLEVELGAELITDPDGMTNIGN